MTRLARLFAIALAVILCASATLAQGRYTWTGAIDTVWSNANNWTPARTSDRADTLIFDGYQIHQPSVANTFTVARIMVTGNTTFALWPTPKIRMTVTGGMPNALEIAAGSSLTLSCLTTKNSSQLIVGTHGGIVAGSLTILGRTTVVCTDTVQQLLFVSGALFNASQEPSSQFPPFGASSGKSNAVRFMAGAVFNHNTPAPNPFQKSAPQSLVVFDPLSQYNFNVTSGSFTLALGGRTYGSLHFGGSFAYQGGSSLSTTINGTLSIGSSSSFAPFGSGTIAVSGDVVNNGTLSMRERLSLAGTSLQTFSGPGMTTLRAGLTLNNSAGARLQQPLDVSDTLLFVSGNLSLGGNTLTLHGPTRGAGSGRCVVTDGTGAVVNSVSGGASVLFPVSANGSTYTPVTVALPAGDPTDSFTARVADGVTPSMPDNSAAVQRTWDINEATSGGNHATLTFQWTALQEGTGFHRAGAALWHWSGSSWDLAGGAPVTGSDPFVSTASQSVSVFSPFVVANGVPQARITPSNLAFGNVPVGISRVDSVSVKNVGTGLLSVTEVAAADNVSFAVPAAGASIAPSDSAWFRFTFQPQTAGAKSSTATFTHDGVSGSDVTVALNGIGTQGGVFVSSLGLDFGQIWVDSSASAALAVTNADPIIQLAVDSVKSTNPFFTVSPASAVVNASATQQFTVSFHPLTSGPQAGLVIFYHSAGSRQDTVRVSGSATVKAAAFQVAGARTLSLGNVKVGQARSDSVKVTNPGFLTLAIGSIVQSDSTNFQVAFSKSMLEPGDSAFVRVTYAPAAVGAQTDTIVISSNAPEGADTLFAHGSLLSLSTIAAARAHPNGTEVIVRGVVTRTMGSYTFIQDATGGVRLYAAQSGEALHDSVASGAVTRGDLLEVQGRTSESFFCKEISGAGIVSFQSLSRGNNLPQAKAATLQQIASSGEEYESQLVSVGDLTVTGTSDEFFTEGTFYGVADSTDQNGSVMLRVLDLGDSWFAGGVPVPVGTFAYTGVVGQTSDAAATGYELLPVDSADIVGTSIVNGVATLPRGIPAEYGLEQNFPNPFNPATTVQYMLPRESRVSVRIFSMLGQEVDVLVDGVQPANYYRVVWQGKTRTGVTAASGVYFCRIQADAVSGGHLPFVKVVKMLLVK